MKSIKELYRIGTGPSSSHTMGPRKAAEMFLERHPDAASFKVTLYGSLAATGKGHMTDVAIIDTLKTVAPVEIAWQPKVFLPFHPNGMTFAALDANNKVKENWTVYSIGGGALAENIDYTGHQNLSAGIDYTFYKDKTLQELTNNYEDSDNQSRHNDSRQQSQRADLYLNHFIMTSGKWKISYGLEASLSNTENKAEALLDNTQEREGTFNLTQKEHSVGAFAGFSHSFGKKLTLNASLTVRYFKAAVDSAGRTSTLWDRADLFPALSAIYRINPTNMLQFSLSSNRIYPSYWATTPNTFYMNVYSVIKGNPQLKPSLNYSMQLTYVLKNKYVLGAFANFLPDKIQQMSYQESDRLQSVFHTINLDVYNMYGLMAVIPFKAGEVLSSRLTLTGLSMRNKGTLVDIDFDRHKLIGRAMLTNTLFLTHDKNLSLDISGDYSTKMIQGIYDIDPMYGLNAALVWTLPKQKLRFTLKADDLLNSRKPITYIDRQGQKSRMELFNDMQSITLTIRYSFGGYKEKKVKSVDTSRFGT